MRQRGTWLVVAALAALGLAAAVDALRGNAADPQQPPKQAGRASTTTTAKGATFPMPLAPSTGLDGELFYTDENCRLRAVRLPSLRNAEAPAWSQCAFSLSPGGQAAKTSWTVWSPDGAYAADVGNSVELEPEGRVVRGSMPAWRPDGTLTYVRGGAVRAFPRGRVVLSAADLRRAAVRHPNVPETRGPLDYVRVKQMGWLTPTRAVVLLGVGVRLVGEFDVTAIFEERRLVTTLAAFQSIDRLWTSPGGRFFALGSDRRLELYDRGGRARALPQLTGPQAIAWSPEDSWAAVATRVSIYVFRMGAGDLSLRRLPITAHDLAWRPAGRAPALGETASLRRWLERAGVVGTLHFSDADCRIRALRMPGVEWSDPVGVRAPCRFSVAPDGTVSDEWIVWQERGPLAAGCHGHSVDVFTPGQEVLFHRGDACRPAWKPDGSLTFIVRGELILAVRFRRERVLLSREDIAKALGPGANLKEVAWIDNRQFAAVLRSGPAATLAVFRGRRPVHPPGFSAFSIEQLRPGRGMIAALTRGPGPASVTFFDLAGGRTFALRAHAFAWSPGGTIVAVAGRRRLFFVEPPTGEFRSLPLVAADVEWVER